MSSPPKGARVLHVDDEPGFAEMTAEFLRREDPRLAVETVTNVQDALRRLEQNAVDCVVSDHDMPGQTGIDLLKEVRETYPDLPFILFTGKGSEEVASDAISAGVTDYLQKEAGTDQYAVLANRIWNVVDQYDAQSRAKKLTRRLEAILENTTTPMFMKDEHGVYLLVNQAFVALFEVDDESEIVGHTDHDLLPDDDLSGILEHDQRVLAGESIEVEERVPVDGDVRVFLSSKVPIYDIGTGAAEDTPVALFGVARDITALKAREAELERYQEYTDDILDTVDDLFFVHDDDGNLQRWNRSFREVTGYSDEEIRAMHGTDFVPQEYQERTATAMGRVFETGQGRLEAPLLLKDGDTIPYEFVANRVIHPDGEPRLVGIGRDVTDREARERELREVTTDLESTVSEKERQNQANDAVLDIVTDTTLSFDEQMGALLDLGVEFLDLEIGIISNIDPPDYTVEHVVSPDGSIEQGAVLDFTDTFCTLVYEADGPVAFRNPESGAVKDHPGYQDLGLQAYLGEPLIVAGTRYGTLNFSSPNPREEPFSDGERAFIRTIAEWVAKEMSRVERETEISRQNERFDELAGMVSHDLQTPIATARGWGELAVETGDTQQMQKALAALDRVDDLRIDLVEVLRTNEVVSKNEPVDVEQIARAVWGTVTTQDLPSLQIRDAVSLESDPDAFRRLLENLFLNAIEHGSEDVTVRIGETDEGIFIEDDGPGIPEDEREDVFMRGFTTKSEGSGVGLANVREIIIALDWDIRVATGSDGGARFEITGVEFVDG